MKKFNLAKGLLVGLLTLALCFTAYGIARASADTVTFQATLDGTSLSGEYTWTEPYVKAIAKGWYTGDPEVDSVLSGLEITGGELRENLQLHLAKSGDNTIIEEEGYSISGAYTYDWEENQQTQAITYHPGRSESSYKKTLSDVLAGLNSASGNATYGIFSLSGDINPPAGVTYSSESGDFTYSGSGDATVTIPVKEIGVTFNITVEYLNKDGSSASGEYTYTVKGDPAKYAENAKITLADIIKGAKNTSGSGMPTSDLYRYSTGDVRSWKINTTAGETAASGGLTGTTAATYLTFDNNVYTFSQDLDDAVVVDLKLVPDKIFAEFTASYSGESTSGEYTARILVDNGTSSGSGDKISYSQIAAALKNNKDNKAYPGKQIVITAISGETTPDGTYDTWQYTVNNGSINKGQAIECGEVTVAEMFDARTGYDPDTDSLVYSSPVPFNLYWIDCKKAAGVSVKGEKLKSVASTSTSGETIEGDVEVYNVASISLGDASTGVKIAENKDAYIYASLNAPDTEKKATYKATDIVYATPYKKVAIVFNYAQASASGEDTIGISSLTTTDTKKAVVTYSGGVATETAKLKDISNIIDSLQWSEDGTTWHSIRFEENTSASGESTKFNTAKLYSYVNGSSKVKLYFRLQGPDDNTKAYRNSKVVKTTVATAAVAKAVKVDALKGTIALKNGYDYVASHNSSETEPDIDAAFTILPFNKGGKAKDKEGKAIDTIETVSFAPVKKVDENAAMFTSVKVKNVAITALEGLETVATADGGSVYYIWVRKSATSTKPAQKWYCVTVNATTAGPVLTYDSGLTYYSVEDEKGVLADPSNIANDESDKNSGDYEYLILSSSDYKNIATIDLANAKWTKLGKGLTVGKSKSKYGKIGAKAANHTLAAGDIVLIRRAGDKASNTLPSEPTPTTVIKTTVKEEQEDGTKKDVQKYVWTAYTAQ